MKNRVLLSIIYLMSLCNPAWSRSGDENSLLFEFKKEISCQSAKQELSGHKILVDCDRSDTRKKRYFGGYYFGKKPVNAIVFELKKNPRIASVTPDTNPNRIQ